MFRLLLTRPLLWIGLLLALPAFGQRPSRSGIGLKVAAQWCTQRAEGISYQPILGMTGGLYFPLLVGPRFELQPELLLSQQGCRLVMAEGEDRTLRTTYAVLPLSAKFYLTNSFNLQAGVAGGKLLAAHVEEQDVLDRYNRFDFGFTSGAGLDLQSGVDLALRYYVGHTPVFAGTTEIYPRNRVVALGLGYRFARLPRIGSRNRR